MNGRACSTKELELVRELYPEIATKLIAERLGWTLTKVYQVAARMGMHKSAEYLASPAACRLRRGDQVGKAFRFDRGHVPANKGLRRPGWSPGRMASTQFKKGEPSQTKFTIGTIRSDGDGYLRIKVRDSDESCTFSGFGNVRIWPLLNRHVWEKERGPIPAGYAVVFKDGDRANCDIENLELVSRSELMRRNTIHRLPTELRDTIMLLGAVKRKVREYAEKHDDGSAQPSV